VIHSQEALRHLAGPCRKALWQCGWCLECTSRIRRTDLNQPPDRWDQHPLSRASAQHDRSCHSSHRYRLFLVWVLWSRAPLFGCQQCSDRGL